MVLDWDQLAPFPATAMWFPVGGIFRPHDSAFRAQTEPLWHPIAESLIDAQQLCASGNLVSFRIYDGTYPAEVFAGEKQAETVIVVQEIENHSVNLRR